jgi:5-deoxy-glucuronate isomerase
VTSQLDEERSNVIELATRGRETEALDLAYGELEPGESVQLEGADEIAAVVLTGAVKARTDSTDLGTAGGRSDPFRELGHAVYAPAGAGLELTAGPQGALLATVRAAPGEGEPGAARIIGPDEQRVASVGTDNWARTVRTILGPEDAASRLLLGETLNPPGNWSSYPPHKHDTHTPPDEVRLEEVYLFRVNPSAGFGVQLLYEPGRERTFIVHDGDVAVIRSGYHPVVAAPGYELYYLWALAGEGRRMIPRLDPDHAWVQESGP